MPAVRAKQDRDHELSVSPEEYAGFIRGIELRSLWLQSATVQNLHGPEQPDKASFATHHHGRWETRPEGFRAFHQWRVHVQADETPAVEIEVEFGLDFTAATPLNDDLFGIFREHNLPVNTWPYLREFVASTLGRMNWIPFTLPALKHSTQTPRDGAERAGGAKTPVRRPRARTRRSSTGA